MTRSRIVYFMGPSGAGKDTLLDWLRAHLPVQSVQSVHWARRTVSRESTPGGEAHESLSAEEFASQREAGAFALHWEANGLGYGVRHEQLEQLEPPEPLTDGPWVLVNGSRAYLADAIALFPSLVAVHITASPDVLRARLVARGRETPERIEARVQRALAFSVPHGTAAIEVHNDRSIDDAGQALLLALKQLPGWPQATPHNT